MSFGRGDGGDDATSRDDPEGLQLQGVRTAESAGHTSVMHDIV